MSDTFKIYFDRLKPEFITWEFYKQYLDKEPPFGTIGSIVFLRTYSHYIPELKRREYWCEVVLRCVEFSLSLDSKTLFPEQEREAQLLFDLWFNLKAFPSGRTLWVGNPHKDMAEANFNCSFRTINSIEAYQEMIHLLMLGVGVGFSVEERHTKSFPLMFNNKKVIHKYYRYIPKLENTLVFLDDKPVNDFKYEVHKASNILIKIGDSRKGWEEALLYYLYSFSSNSVKEILIEYDNIRPEGTRLKTMGGRASGYAPLKLLFQKIHWVINKVINNTLTSVDYVDIATSIAEAIVVGGVRRSSLIALGDSNDINFQEMKVGLWDYNPSELFLAKLKSLDLLNSHIWDVNGYNSNPVIRETIDFIDSFCPKYRWQKNRVMSNNSIMLDQFEEENMIPIFDSISHNGEPGFINRKAASLRRIDFYGVNPCSEILLNNQGVCNLVEVNVLSFVETDSEGKTFLDIYNLYPALAFSTKHCSRITNINFWHPEWDKVQKTERLLGVSLTGLVEAFNKLNYSEEQIKDFYKSCQEIVDKTAKYYHYHLEIPESLLKTCIKPSGTISNLPGVSSGIHAPYAPYYIRRVRVSCNDPIAKALVELSIPVVPENGYNSLEESPIWVFSFYVKTNATHKSSEESAITQLERYKLVQNNYVQHNTSITVTFKPEEVPSIINWLKENFDSFVGVSFLPSYDGVYPNLPYEAISEEEYLEKVKSQKILTEKELNLLISKYEIEEEEYELDKDCQSGLCPVR